MRSNLLAASLALALACAACKTDKPAAQDAGGVPITADAAAAPTGLSESEARAILKGACLSCHAEEMLLQQRLTEAQWTKVVTKMVGWGANLDAKDAAPLVSWLAATYGPDASAFDLVPLGAAEAEAEIAPQPDGPFANGDPERGRALYTDRCSGCHGPEARGSLGVNLVDRPFLWRAADVAFTIRRGRGKMTAISMSDAEIGDVLAHLRRLKSRQ